MGLPRGDERVRGGRAFKGGGAPRLGLGPEAALKVMAHSGPRAGGGHRRGLWVKGARGGLEVEKGFSRVGMGLRGGQRLGYGAASASEGAASQPCLGTDVGNPARQLCSLASRRSAANSGCGEVTVMVAFHIFSTVGIYLDLF